MRMVTHGMTWLCPALLAMQMLACGAGPSDTLGELESLRQAATEPDVLETVSGWNFSEELEEYTIFSKEPGVSAKICVRDQCRTFVTGVSRFDDPEELGQPHDPTDPDAFRADSLFRIGSGTKAFLAAIIFQLIERGQISLDDKISRFFPEYRRWGEITVRQLMHMNAGIPEYIRDKLNLAKVLLEKSVGIDARFTPRQLLEIVADRDLMFKPGERVLYTQTNYLILALIAEKVTGQKLRDLFQTMVFDRVGLKTAFEDAGASSRIPIAGLVSGYYNLSLAHQSPIGVLIPKEMKRGANIVESDYMFHPSTAWGTGDLIATIDDAMRFWKAHLREGRFVSSSALRSEMMRFEPGIVEGEPFRYGLALGQYFTPIGEAYGHGGVQVGYTSRTYIFKDRPLEMIFFHNYGPSQADDFHRNLMRRISAREAEAGACRPLPASRVWNQAEDDQAYAHIRFKGPLNADESVNDLGVGYVKVALPNKSWTRLIRDTNVLYPYESSRKVYLSGEQLVFESMGENKGSSKYLVRVEVPRELWSRTTPDSITYPTPDGSGLFVRVDHLQADRSGVNLKRCTVAATAPSARIRFQRCAAAESDPSPASTLGFFLKVPLAQDQKELKEILDGKGLPTCTCARKDNPSWTPCTD